MDPVESITSDHVERHFESLELESEREVQSSKPKKNYQHAGLEFFFFYHSLPSLPVVAFCLQLSVGLCWC